jgi:hypothetical protein
MKVQPGLVFAGLLALGLSTYSCANGDTVSGDTGSGGNGSGSGGSSSGNGGSSSGGSTGSGGSSKGGTTGSGGSVSSGGTTGSGGSSKGGTTGSGGAKGGTTGSGGNVSSGGTTGSSGGTTGSGGSTTGSGGSGSVACTTTFDVSSAGFVTMPVKGGTCWSGYAYTFGDTYGTTFLPMTPTSLMSMGNIVAVSGSMYSYAGLAFNLGQSNAGGNTNTPVTPTGTGLTFNYTATNPAGTALRVQISDGTNSWCATAVNAQSIPYSSFNTKCYDSPPDGTAYAKQAINAIQLQVAGGTTGGAYTLSISSVTEN